MANFYPEYPDLLNIVDTAKILHCRPSTVCRLCRKKELSAFKVGKAWNIPQDSLYSFVQRKTKGEN